MPPPAGARHRDRDSRRIHGPPTTPRSASPARQNPDNGMVIDLGYLRSRLKTLGDALDHRFLDEIPGLGKPTLENLCLFFCRFPGRPAARSQPHPHLVVLPAKAPSRPRKAPLERQTCSAPCSIQDHRVKTTQCELHYEGSCAIDKDLLDAANIVENEQVHIWNIDNGERFVTYAIKGQRGNGMISVNGSAARRAAVGDLLIIASFAQVHETDVATHQPRLVFVDDANRQVELRHHVPTQQL
ncbi:WD repeat-containing protein 86 [Manis javanica]|nr:WD repeat-containing protein 86 [Manis javanica]